MTDFRWPIQLIVAVLCVAPLSAIAQAQLDNSDTEIPCGIRCALGAIALTAEGSVVPQFDPASIQEMSDQGQSFLDVKQFLRDHRMAGKAYADVSLASLDPSLEQSVILQLSPSWLERTSEPRRGIHFEHDDLPHFVLTVDRDGDRLLVWDVSAGHEYVPLAELEPYFTGNAMEVRQRPQLFNGYFEKNPSTAYLIGGAIAALFAAAVLRYRRSRTRMPETIGQPTPPND